MEAFYPLSEERAKVSFQGQDNYSILRLPRWSFERGLVSHFQSVEILKRAVFLFLHSSFPFLWWKQVLWFWKRQSFIKSYLQWWKAMFCACNELFSCTFWAPFALCLVWVWVTTFLEPCLYNWTSCSPYTLWPWRWRQHVPLKHWYLPTKLQNVATQETIIWGITTVKTSKLIKLKLWSFAFLFELSFSQSMLSETLMHSLLAKLYFIIHS